MVFTYNWNLTDLKNVRSNNLKAFTTFSCGGGADMGLMMAGYKCLGGCEIDKNILKFYNANFNHKYIYNDDIRDFVVKARNKQLPQELYELDLLHQSPPCSTFSMSGLREKSWGVEKVFHEGQKKQRLDDLFFEAIELVNQLRPKVATFENVEGLIKGNAKIYFNKIIEDLTKIGYITQAFIIDGSTLGLPQRRRRLFFIAQRQDFFKKKLQLNFNEQAIPFYKIRDDSCKECIEISHKAFQYYINKKKDDFVLSQSCKRNTGKTSWFNYKIIDNKDVLSTICTDACSSFFLKDVCRCINKQELLLASSFPQDYNFLNAKLSKVCWLLGMCIPPLMMYKISKEIEKQLFNK